MRFYLSDTTYLRLSLAKTSLTLTLVEGSKQTQWWSK